MGDAWTIETADLRKRYADVDAVRGLTLQVPRGSIYGFLGRNGAGKTTTIKVLLGMASATFFSLAFLLSTVFNDVWRPMLIALAVAVGVALAGHVSHGVSRYGIYGVMSGEVYFRTGRQPWGGLIASAALSAAMLYAATVNFARRDF